MLGLLGSLVHLVTGGRAAQVSEPGPGKQAMRRVRVIQWREHMHPGVPKKFRVGMFRSGGELSNSAAGATPSVPPDPPADRAFAGSVALSKIRRPFEELVEYLFRELAFPAGAFLLTGTGIVPPHDFTLVSGDVVRIAAGPIGELVNRVA